MANKNNIKVALCCIACMENDYIQEWVDYYFKTVQVDDIFIYDNNKTAQSDQKISDVFKDNDYDGHLHIIDKIDVVMETF